MRLESPNSCPLSSRTLILGLQSPHYPLNVLSVKIGNMLLIARKAMVLVVYEGHIPERS